MLSLDTILQNRYRRAHSMGATTPIRHVTRQ
jgi:hypothetical protein